MDIIMILMMVIHAQQTRGSGTEGGGMVAEVEGYLWMRRWAVAEAAAWRERGVGGGGSKRKRKWCVVCPLTYFTRQS